MQAGSSSKSGLAEVDGSAKTKLTKRRRAPRGPYWNLAKETCAICHHKLVNTMDAQLGLPPVHPPTVESTDEETGDETTGGPQPETNEDTRIHVPARTDCDEECVYCYYCIAEALAKEAKERDAQVNLKREDSSQEKHMNGSAVEKGWTCLRCGDDVHGCKRVEPE